MNTIRVNVSSNEFYRKLGQIDRSVYRPTVRWCKIHPTSIWGEGYKQCAAGFRLKENCEEGK